MSGYRFILLACFLMVIASSSARPGIVRDLYHTIFGDPSTKYNEGYEKGLKDSQLYMQHPYPVGSYPPPQYPVGYQPALAPGGSYEAHHVNYNKDDVKHTNP